MKCIKKRILIKKYLPTTESMQNDLHLINMMKHDDEFLDYFRHIRACELRCLKRLKDLK